MGQGSLEEVFHGLACKLIEGTYVSLCGQIWVVARLRNSPNPILSDALGWHTVLYTSRRIFCLSCKRKPVVCKGVMPKQRESHCKGGGP